MCAVRLTAKTVSESRNIAAALLALVIYRICIKEIGNAGIFSARCNIYISRLCYDVSVRLSVCLSVTEVHWVAVHAGKRGGIISRYASHCRALLFAVEAKTRLCEKVLPVDRPGVSAVRSHPVP